MTRTILLADDSVTIQKVIELTFMDEDYEVIAVGNGDDAIDELDRSTPDFVIADVHMPGANGYDVAKHSKSLRPEVPVLLLVSTFEPFDEQAAERSGCDAFLKKPFDSQELQRLVEDLSAEAAGERAGAAAGPAREEAPAHPEGGDSVEAGGADAPASPATPFSIGLDEDDEIPATQVPPPESVGSTAGGGSAWDDRTAVPSEGATQADEEVFEMIPEDFEEAAEHAGPTSSPELPAGGSSEEPEAPAGIQAAAGAAGESGGGEDEERPRGPLSDEDVERIARRVVELLGDRPVRDVAWEVVPDLAEVVIRDRLRELETQVESAD